MTDRNPSPLSVVVPVEPTLEMIDAAANAPFSDTRKATTNVYDRRIQTVADMLRAGIAAAPAPSSLAGGALAVAQAEHDHWVTMAATHLPEGRHGSFAAADLERARIAQRIAEGIAALSPEAPAREGVTEAALREALTKMVAAVEKAKGVWATSTATPTQCGYLMSSYLCASLVRKAKTALALTPRHEAQARDELPEDDELPGDFLARVGMDGALWATEFRKMALKLGYSDMDEGWLIGWFCNAVMAGYDHAERKFDPALTPRHEAPVFHANLMSHEDNEAWAKLDRHEAPASEGDVS